MGFIVSLIMTENYMNYENIYVFQRIFRNKSKKMGVKVKCLKSFESKTK